MKHSDLQFIDKIGVECEGGWDEPPYDLVGDGSVYVDVASPPLYIEDLCKWIETNIPDKVNKSCGTHVHISTRKVKDYMRLMEKEFFDYFINSMTAWGNEMKLPSGHLFWNRLEGGNQYCHKKFDPEGQVNQKGKAGNRYTQLNFCYGLHGTLECRLFPGFDDAQLCINAVKAFVNCVESFLRDTPDKLNLEEEIELAIPEEPMSVGV